MGDVRETATLAAGCFWCVEALFKRLEGVERVASGYAGGEVANPTYEEVCSGTTGHAEAIQITFDPEVISFEELLQVFWRSHDPTTRDRQGADVGSQYRSAIFCHDERQRQLAERSRAEAETLWIEPIVTEIVPFKNFYPAEGYHQDYYRLNRNQPYCRLVIDPKIQKLQKDFSERFKETPGD
ncbi:peptide-methionine (S)-S-oxide reductase MsrA [Geotalea uraniireducens]|uniref:Peptide methionine sulfoxide reductase MsrA n=1 Tax=Geotalea uraniireducens (strain Rf4) TaxID=351605 RepID=A5GET7_GEOUR|nr:peptide-methionine (S)-S-oxide reductase MsrA [Geotalea uraniireducens]ABQ25942.1 peptide methionine sulfoxide reductase [Geotalea uraniireducens Rf4]